MILTVSIDLNLKVEEVTRAVLDASREAMRDTVVTIFNESIIGSPKKTGHNRRSLVGEVSGMGEVAKGADAEPEKSVDDDKLEGAVYSTSGYGGWLEVGHFTAGARKTGVSFGRWISARPYMKPALDLEFTLEKFTERIKRHLK